MKITKEQLEQIIREELDNTLNEISLATKQYDSGFKGISDMAFLAGISADNLAQKFDDEPEELIRIQKLVRGIKQAADWQLGAHEMPTALHQMDPAEKKSAIEKAHTIPYKRDLEE